jgi:hypothetical protein
MTNSVLQSYIKNVLYFYSSVSVCLSRCVYVLHVYICIFVCFICVWSMVVVVMMLLQFLHSTI